MSSGFSIDVVFDRSTVYRLWETTVLPHNLIVRISSRRVAKHIPNNANNHPIHGNYGDKKVYHGVLNAYALPTTPVESQQVAVKWVRGRSAVENLRYEASLYDGILSPLQGTVVPWIHGFFSGVIDDVNVGCLVMEWCEGNRQGRPEEINRLRMLAVSLLHRVGIYHGELLDGHHMRVHPDGSIRVIDYSNAFVHACRGETPCLLNEKEGEVPVRCRELYEMERLYGKRA